MRSEDNAIPFSFYSNALQKFSFYFCLLCRFGASSSSAASFRPPRGTPWMPRPLPAPRRPRLSPPSQSPPLLVGLRPPGRRNRSALWRRRAQLPTQRTPASSQASFPIRCQPLSLCCAPTPPMLQHAGWMAGSMAECKAGRKGGSEVTSGRVRWQAGELSSRAADAPGAPASHAPLIKSGSVGGLLLSAAAEGDMESVIAAMRVGQDEPGVLEVGLLFCFFSCRLQGHRSCGPSYGPITGSVIWASHGSCMTHVVIPS